MPFKVFFSYAHRDEPLLEKLKEHLAPLKSQGLIDRFWYDREISAGTEWEPEIIRHLETADIILLLVSAAFMNSEYCYGKELQRAIQRHNRKEARVVPIILSPIYWQIPPLDKLQALPTDAKPVNGAGWHSVDEALLDVTKGIRTVIKDLQRRPQPSPSYQYQIGYINEQVKKGKSPIVALNECDPELGRLFQWVGSYQDQRLSNDLQERIEKLLQEVSVVGDGDLRVQAEVTPDTIGVLADSFNYMIEELAKIVIHTRSTVEQNGKKFDKLLKIIEEQKLLANDLQQELDTVMKNLPNESASTQFSIIAITIEQKKRIEALEMVIKHLKNLSEDLHASTSTWSLP
jgi:hypothetical protein